MITQGTGADLAGAGLTAQLPLHPRQVFGSGMSSEGAERRAMACCRSEAAVPCLEPSLDSAGCSMGRPANAIPGAGHDLLAPGGNLTLPGSMNRQMPRQLRRRDSFCKWAE